MSTQVRLRTDATPEQLLKQLILSPLIYIRLVGILFSIIVFGCVADQLVLNTGQGTECFYNIGTGSSACSFAIAVGVIGFLIFIVFLVKDILYIILDFSDGILLKKVMLMVDAVTNGLWGFMWFVCFCYTADQLRRTNNIGVISNTSIRNCANTGVAFSFFTIFVCVAIVMVNVIFFIRVMKGTDAPKNGSGYASFPEGSGGGEGSEGSEEGDKQYTPPEY